MTKLSIGIQDRLLCEGFLSWNIASAVILICWYGNRTFDRELSFLMGRVNAALSKKYLDDFGRQAALIICILVATVALFAALRLLSRAQLSLRSFLTMAGVLNTVAAPIGYVVARRLVPFEFYGLDYAAWLPLEAVLALVVVLLFRWNRWPVSTWANLILLAAHTAVWYRAFMFASVGEKSLLTIPITTACCMVVWARLVNSEEFRRPKTGDRRYVPD